MMMRHKSIKIICSVVMLIFAMIFLKLFLSQCQDNMVKKLVRFNEVRTINSSEDVFFKNVFYVADKKSGIIQIFNADGQFITGFHMPMKGGKMWLGVNENFYAYSIREKCLLTINFENSTPEYHLTQEVYYDSYNAFKKDLRIDDTKKAKMKNDVVLYKNKQIRLVVGINHLSAGICGILSALFWLGFLWCTGLFSRILKEFKV